MHHLGVPFAFVALAFAFQSAGAAGEKSEGKVKASATASKIDDAGKQTVTITLDIAKGWHLYANPVNNDLLEDAQTKVKITSKSAVKVRPTYPAGKTVSQGKDKYDVYEGVVKIQADVVRAKGDTGPLQIVIDVQACDDKVCLRPGQVKLTLP